MQIAMTQMVDAAVVQHHDRLIHNIFSNIKQINNMKKIIISLTLILALPVLLKAQYTGGDGNGDASISLSNVPLLIQKTAMELPSEYSLYQNYPNPFNPATKIKFDLSKTGEVSLKIYDINGREVAKLVNEKLFAGSYEATWDASSFPSGVYFCRLNAGNFEETKKMLLIK
jgi:hypothetical protein